MAFKKFSIRIILPTIIFIIISLLIFYFYSDKKSTNFTETYLLENRDIEDALLLTGRLVPKKSVDLTFSDSGEIQKIYFEEGQAIKKDNLFAELTHNLLDAELNEATAQIATRQASLDILLSGARAEDITEQEAATELAEIQRDHAVTNLESNAKDAKNQADNAIRNAVDDFFVNPRSSNPQLGFPLSKNQSLRLELESERQSIEILLNKWQLDPLVFTLENYKNQSGLTLERLDIIREFLRIAALAVNAAEATEEVDGSTIRTWKTNLAAQRTTIDGAIQSVQSGQQAVSEKILTLARAKSALDRLKNGSTPEEISAKRAEILEAIARKNIISTKIKNRKIYAPINGIVAEVKKTNGENVTSQDVIGLLISENDFEVELEVPELNITEIEPSDKVQVTFAAIPNKIFSGQINEIANVAETDANLVPYYKVTVLLEATETTNLRPGLIADVTVITDTYKNVLSVPARFITTNEDGADYLSTLDPENKILRNRVTRKETVGGMVIIESSSLQAGMKAVLEK